MPMQASLGWAWLQQREAWGWWRCFCSLGRVAGLPLAMAHSPEQQLRQMAEEMGSIWSTLPQAKRKAGDGSKQQRRTIG